MRLSNRADINRLFQITHIIQEVGDLQSQIIYTIHIDKLHNYLHRKHRTAQHIDIDTGSEEGQHLHLYTQIRSIDTVYNNSNICKFI